jgi:hypothetical protein
MPKRIGCAMRNGMNAARRVAIPHHYERGLQTKAGKPVEGTEAVPADVRDGYHRAVSAAREGPLSASTIALDWSLRRQINALPLLVALAPVRDLLLRANYLVVPAIDGWGSPGLPPFASRKQADSVV